MLRTNANTLKRPLVVTVASCVVAFGIASLATAGSAISVAPPDGPVQSVPSDVQEHFAIFRGASTSSMPADVAQEVASPTLFGRNANLAREITTTNGSGWIVPGRDHICIVVPDPVDGYGTVCTPTSWALTNGVVLTMRKSRAAGVASVTLLVPDGLKVVETSPSATTPIPTTAGVVSRVVPEGATLSVSAAG